LFNTPVVKIIISVSQYYINNFNLKDILEHFTIHNIILWTNSSIKRLDLSEFSHL